jgi:DNA-binding transcriptional ArsR family regulator
MSTTQKEDIGNLNVVDEKRVSELAKVLSEESRVRLFSLLLETPATTSEMVARLSLDQPRVSTHLAMLKSSGLVSLSVRGRQHVYAVKSKTTADAIRAFMRLASISAHDSLPKSGISRSAQREVLQDSPVRRARTCYDHLAGVAGVALLDEMKTRRWVRGRTQEIRGKTRRLFELTTKGKKSLTRAGIEWNSGDQQRLFAYGCMDWTERRDHLGGSLGKNILDQLFVKRIVERGERNGSRALRMLKPVSQFFEPQSNQSAVVI